MIYTVTWELGTVDGVKRALEKAGDTVLTAVACGSVNRAEVITDRSEYDVRQTVWDQNAGNYCNVQEVAEEELPEDEEF